MQSVQTTVLNVKYIEKKKITILMVNTILFNINAY